MTRTSRELMPHWRVGYLKTGETELARQHAQLAYDLKDAGKVPPSTQIDGNPVNRDVGAINRVIGEVDTGRSISVGPLLRDFSG